MLGPDPALGIETTPERRIGPRPIEGRYALETRTTPDAGRRALAKGTLDDRRSAGHGASESIHTRHAQRANRLRRGSPGSSHLNAWRAIVRLARTPRREIFLGSAGPQLALLSLFAPGSQPSRPAR